MINNSKDLTPDSKSITKIKKSQNGGGGDETSSMDFSDITESENSISIIGNENKNKVNHSSVSSNRLHDGQNKVEGSNQNYDVSNVSDLDSAMRKEKNNSDPN
jgi:hypothetical protein